jgi:HEPN domain-containing protein
MPPDPPRIDPRVIAAYLDDVAVDLDAARRLIADPPNRLAGFHVHQAAEKLVKAVHLARGLRITTEHNIEVLVDQLPADDAWRPKLEILEPLSDYATSFRYPSPTGKRKGGPAQDEVLVWIKIIEGLQQDARALIA